MIQLHDSFSQSVKHIREPIIRARYIQKLNLTR